MRGLTRLLMIAGMAVAGTAVIGGVPAYAGTLALARPVAYVRDGSIYVSSGVVERRLTTDRGNARPRFSPDGRRLAYLHDGHLWVMKADGTAKRQVSSRPSGGASWSPDGRWLAFASLGCTGGPSVYRLSSTDTYAQPEVLFPISCRGVALPPVPHAAASNQPAAAAGPNRAAPNRAADNPASSELTDRLRVDDAVAWSPDGSHIAFRGGECEGMFDDCLSVGEVAGGAEAPVAGYGGGGEHSGFGVVPAWRPDGGRLSWTGYADNDTIHVTEADASGAHSRRIGTAGDREMVYLTTTKGVLTGWCQGRSWIMLVDLTTGRRTPFHVGSQPSVATPPIPQG